ncbi:hypothetical protein JCM10207_008361 [Rhodosporidiobolus poonsookiae]
MDSTTYSLQELASWRANRVRMMLFVTCAAAVLFGMTLRMAVTYARRFISDSRLNRFLVVACAILATAHTSSVSANLFISLTAVLEPQHDLGGELIKVQICGRTWVVLMTIVAEGTFVARLWSTTRNLVVRGVSLVIWLAATALLVAWFATETGKFKLAPLIAGKVAAFGISAIWLFFILSAFLSINLMRNLQEVRPPEEEATTPFAKLFQRLCLFIETAGLLALDLFLAAVLYAASLASVSCHLAFLFFYFLFPSIAVFSVIFALNQRPPPPLPPSGSFITTSKARNVVFERSNSAPEEMAAVSIPGGAPTGTIIFDPDDPQTWRGDAARLFPSLRIDPEHSLSQVGSRTGTLGARSIRSASGIPQAPSMLSLPSVAAAGTRRGSKVSFSGVERARTIDEAERGVGSFGGGSSFGRFEEYDEEIVEMEPTVLSLNLDALRDVNAANWGPKEKAEREQQPDSAPTTPSTSSPVSSSSV